MTALDAGKKIVKARSKTFGARFLEREESNDRQEQALTGDNRTRKANLIIVTLLRELCGGLLGPVTACFGLLVACYNLQLAYIFLFRLKF